jgi:hypothetical protein
MLVTVALSKTVTFYPQHALQLHVLLEKGTPMNRLGISRQRLKTLGICFLSILVVLTVIGIALTAGMGQSQARSRHIHVPYGYKMNTWKSTGPLHQPKNAPKFITNSFRNHRPTPTPKPATATPKPATATPTATATIAPTATATAVPTATATPSPTATATTIPTATATTVPTATPTPPPTDPPACTTTTLNLKILIISSDGNEADLPAITQALDYTGTPYTVYKAALTPNGLTPGMLSNNCQGNYQGVILTNGQLSYFNGSAWTSALSQTEWTNLWTYEASFGVREVSWYTYPTADFGFQAPTGAVDTSTAPLSVQLTAQGKTTFSYMNPSSVVQIQNAYTYLAQPLADGATTPLITDAQGNALALIHAYTDGRQTLATTYDSNPNLLHEIVYSYGYINWLTSGLFLGYRHVVMSPQSDDEFIDDDIWTPSTACGTPVDQTGTTYRITGADLQAFTNWQKQVRAGGIAPNLMVSMAFNGTGTVPGAYTPDTLTAQAKTDQSEYYWISHTYDHTNLDNVNGTTTTTELTQNNQVAQQMGFTNYSSDNMVTPDVSGLTNSAFLQAASNFGIRYLVSDTSVAGYNNPAPNVGIYNPLVPSILEVPRHPVNLFYNVATPDEWTAEYNCMYASYWGHNLTYAELIDEESQNLLIYLLRGDLDPWMFHQPNLAAYDGTHSLLGDLLDATLAKYAKYYNVQVLFPSFDDIGATFANRIHYGNAGVTASITGKTLTLTAQNAATVPVTGVNSTGSEQYGGQYISYITLNAGQSVTIPLP